MFKRNTQQHSLNGRSIRANRIIASKYNNFQEQLLVLKQVNNLILGRKNSSPEVVTKNYFGQMLQK